MQFSNPHSLLEAYYSIYETSEYLSEEERQLELLKKTKKGYEARSMTRGAISKQKGVPVEEPKKETETKAKKPQPSPGQLSLNLKKKETLAQKLGKVATGLDKVAKAKFQRGIGARNTSDEALRRLMRRHLAKEDYFDYLVNYIMEEGYEYIDALEIIEEMDDETIEMILNEA